MGIVILFICSAVMGEEWQLVLHGSINASEQKLEMAHGRVLIVFKPVLFRYREVGRMYYATSSHASLSC